jgi:enamine deaminase RidA (YjgF/YER057c/UK114 family)
MISRAKLAQLGVVLPEPPAPRGEYVPAVVHGGVVYVSGQLSREGNFTITGPVSSATPQDLIKRAAHACVLRALSAIDQAVGLENVSRILFLRGFVFAVPGFVDFARVLDEASKLLADIFGEQGVHARSVAGVAGLPGNGLLEIELTAVLGPLYEGGGGA